MVFGFIFCNAWMHNYVLTPGRYVGVEDVDDDDELFEEKMEWLVGGIRSRFC